MDEKLEKATRAIGKFKAAHKQVYKANKWCKEAQSMSADDLRLALDLSYKKENEEYEMMWEVAQEISDLFGGVVSVEAASSMLESARYEWDTEWDEK